MTEILSEESQWRLRVEDRLAAERQIIEAQLATFAERQTREHMKTRYMLAVATAPAWGTLAATVVGKITPVQGTLGSFLAVAAIGCIHVASGLARGSVS